MIIISSSAIEMIKY